MNAFLRTVLRYTALSSGLAALFGSAILPGTGCSSASEEPTCVGGYVTAAGACVAACDPSKCVDGNVCVENQCRLQCDTHGACTPNSQLCSPAKTDAGAAVSVCLENGHNVPSTGVGQGKPCPFGQGDCTTTVCPNGLECDAMACGGSPAACIKDVVACAGKENCNIGQCSGKDKTRCTVTTCAATECKALSCLSSGEGDATAFCTATDCSSDEACGSGFFCGLVHDPHDRCGETCTNGKCASGQACTKDGNCQLGNNAFCGKTLEPCIDLATKPAGSTYEAGTRCLMHKQCLRRGPCAPCKENLDCAGTSADLCVTIGASKGCAQFCASDDNCTSSEACTPAGSTCAASPTAGCTTAADCPTKDDQCVPRSVCVPRSPGGCRAENVTGSKFCYTCTTDLDCGPVDSNWICNTLSGGERACFDLGSSSTCAKDADCPKSPGGKPGACLDENDGVGPTDPNFHQCYFPAKYEQGQLVGYSCYP